MPELPQLDPIWRTRLEPIYRLYASLLRDVEPELGLGGRLVYAGELHEDGCRLVRASNIAGAASLSATADASAQRHAIRDGVVDFLVNSLDEALRILKNEVRKRQPVSVAVSAAPGQIAEEMRERGVLPDLLSPAARNAENVGLAEFLAHGARCIETDPLPDEITFEAWAPAGPEFDALATSILPENDHLNRRWMRTSPRYLGPGARRVRSLACGSEIATRLAKAMAVLR
jgi:Urocanase Rossmann-like domain